jgi:hypothetical protein
MIKYKRINIFFKNKNYEVEVNPNDSIHHVISDLYNHIIKKDLNIFENVYYSYLIENKDYFIKIIENNQLINTYLNPNNIIGLYCKVGELIINFDIIILLHIITEYITFFIKIIIITNIIIQYILLNICEKYLSINIHNKSFEYFNDFTFKILFITLMIFTIMWVIILYNFYIKNKNKKYDYTL